ncbi:21.9 kDa heat shock protein-like [Miscanthus floridulus]|uniref:21.9 kDa heat shock protein-like n=1 Tax=Miscanthus floridulus TaxID=154761 RepID=UPI003458D9B1
MADAVVSSMKSSASAAVVLAVAAVTMAFLAAPVVALVPYGRAGGGLFDLMLLDDPFRVLEQSPLAASSVPRASLDSASVALARCDWKETPEAHVILVDVPGVRREDVKVEVEENSRVLRVSGERRADEEKEGERAVGRFWRRFRMPTGADVDSVSARLEDGVLTVTVPKVAGHRGREPRVISIAGGDVAGAEAEEVKASKAEM